MPIGCETDNLSRKRYHSDMDAKDRLAIAQSQLDRVLGFFARADAKASTIFAVDTALLAILCINLRPADVSHWYVVVPGAAAITLIVASLIYVYRSSFPSLKGGHSSLIYFCEIAKRTECKYIDEFERADAEALTADVLGQVWRNSEILKLKFDSVKAAFVLSALALVPWAIFIAATALQHAQVPILKV